MWSGFNLVSTIVLNCKLKENIYTKCNQGKIFLYHNIKLFFALIINYIM